MYNIQTAGVLAKHSELEAYLLTVLFSVFVILFYLCNIKVFYFITLDYIS